MREREIVFVHADDVLLLQTYPRVGTRVGRFYDEFGKPTAALQSVRQRAEEGKKLQVRRE